MEQDDAALIERAAGGDSAAFAALLDMHYAAIFRMAYHLCGQREDAEDITQIACLKVAQNIASFRGSAKFTTWLYTIVLNSFRDWADLSANKARRVPLDGLENRLAANDDPERNAQARDGLRRLDILPREERETLILVFAQGFSHKEAAAILGCAESTVSWRVHEARRKLGAQEEGQMP